MAATAVQGLIELYEDVTPDLPTLWTGLQPEGTARTPPNAMLTDKGAQPTMQRLKGKGGNTGIKYETFKGLFQLWYAGEASEDPNQNGYNAAVAGATALKAVLLPFALEVDLARQTYLTYQNCPVVADSTRGTVGQFVFRADIPVTAVLDY
jgi:hypothetical protein